MEKVDVLIQEAMEDEEAVRPGKDRGAVKAPVGQRDSTTGSESAPSSSAADTGSGQKWLLA